MIPILDFEKCEGEPISAGAATELVPVARVARLRLFGGRVGAIWSRPVGVWVRAEGEERWLPVRDSTRRAQLGIWAAALAVVGLVAWRRKQRNSDWRREVRR